MESGTWMEDSFWKINLTKTSSDGNIIWFRNDQICFDYLWLFFLLTVNFGKYDFNKFIRNSSKFQRQIHKSSRWLGWTDSPERVEGKTSFSIFLLYLCSAKAILKPNIQILCLIFMASNCFSSLFIGSIWSLSLKKQALWPSLCQGIGRRTLGIWS